MLIISLTLHLHTHGEDFANSATLGLELVCAISTLGIREGQIEEAGTQSLPLESGLRAQEHYWDCISYK